MDKAPESPGNATHRALANFSEQQIKELVEILPDALLLVNHESTIGLANLKAEQIFGCPSELLVGQKLQQLIPERFRTSHHLYMDQFFSNPTPRPMGARLNLLALRSDGSEFPADISLSPMRSTGEVLVACIVRDISERKQAELARREQEETYRALFEYANDAIFLLSLDGYHFQVNQKAADLLGYTREELVGLGVRDIVAPTDYPASQGKLDSLLAGQTLPLYERLFRKKDGSIIPVEINVSVVRDNEGKPKYIQSIVRDITERKNSERQQRSLMDEIRQSRENLRQMEARLEQVREAERQQLATELHDRVGQTLTGLAMNLQIIRHQVPPGTSQTVLQRIEDSTDLLNETNILVRNVMADLRPPMLDDYGLLSALNWYGQNFSQRTGIVVKVRGEELQPRLPTQVEIVLFRIVQEAFTNITKHAQARQVEILMESTPQSARLSVVDDGVGFNLGKVLAPRREAHWGLFTMQERAVAIGGRLAIESAPGKGTCISIDIDREGANR